VAAALVGGSGYSVGSRRAQRPQFVVFHGSATVQDPTGDVQTFPQNGPPQGSPSFDLIGASLTIDGGRVEVVLRSDQPFARDASARLSGSITMVEDEDHPLYDISLSPHDMVVTDSAALHVFELAAQKGGGACREELCNRLDKFETLVRRGFMVSGDAITVSLSRRDLPRLPPFFYWKVLLTEHADNPSQTSFDDSVPNGKNYADSIFPDGYARFPN